jgi:hypothetical protein
MPIDPKEGLTYLGFDPEAFEDVDAFKAAADSTYVRRELAHTDKEIGGKVFGKINGTLRNNLKGVAKELEIEGVDFETMDPTEGIKILGKSLKEKTSTLRSELDTAKKGGASTKDIAEMQAKLDAVTKERDAFGQSAKDFESKYTELDTTIKSREAKAKEDAFYKDALSAIKWSPDVSDFAKTGFETAFRQQYKPDFYEGGTRTCGQGREHRHGPKAGADLPQGGRPRRGVGRKRETDRRGQACSGTKDDQYYRCRTWRHATTTRH